MVRVLQWLLAIAQSYCTRLPHGIASQVVYVIPEFHLGTLVSSVMRQRHNQALLSTDALEPHGYLVAASAPHSYSLRIHQHYPAATRMAVRMAAISAWPR